VVKLQKVLLLKETKVVHHQTQALLVRVLEEVEALVQQELMGLLLIPLVLVVQEQITGQVIQH
tara:strand:- start:881 stop:1069 length:189 start_codon:yes stop_codon:yes gene_type:complete